MSRIDEVQKDLDETKQVMSENIDDMLNNIEKAEVVNDKTENLKENAKVFEKNTDDLKKVMWWKNVKIIAAIATVVVVVIAVIVVVIVLTV